MLYHIDGGSSGTVSSVVRASVGGGASVTGSSVVRASVGDGASLTGSSVGGASVGGDASVTAYKDGVVGCIKNRGSGRVDKEKVRSPRKRSYVNSKRFD